VHQTSLVILVENNSLHRWLLDLITEVTLNGHEVVLVTLEKEGPIHKFYSSNNLVLAYSLTSNFKDLLRTIIRKKSFGKLEYYSLGHKPNIVSIFFRFLFDGRITMNYVQQTNYFTNMALSRNLFVSIKGHLHEFISKWYFARSDFVQSVSLDTMNKLHSLGVSNHKIINIPLGINFTKLDESSNGNLSLKNVFTDLIPFVLSIGRLAPEKNHFLTIEAFAHFYKKFPNFKLVILGEGPLLESLKEFVTSLSLQNYVFLLGFREDVGFFYEKCSLFVHSSTAEGYASVQMEARLRNKMIVSSDCGVAQDMAHLADPYVKLFQKTTPLELAQLWIDAVQARVTDQSWTNPNLIYRAHNTSNVYSSLLRHLFPY